MRQDLEGEGQQPVAREHRGRFVEFLVAGRPPAPQIAVVHRREVVVDEAVGVHHLDRAGDLERAPALHREEMARSENQKGPQALPRRQRRIAHGFEDPRLGAWRGRQEPIEGGVDEPSRARERLGKRRVGGPGAERQSCTGSVVTDPSAPLTMRSTRRCASARSPRSGAQLRATLVGKDRLVELRLAPLEALHDLLGSARASSKLMAATSGGRADSVMQRVIMAA